MKYTILNIVSFFYLSLFISCSTSKQQAVQTPVIESNNRYDSEFPVKDVSKQLDYLSTTVKKLDCLAFYMSYVFPPGNNVDLNNMDEAALKKVSIGSSVTNESVTGTAIVIYYDGGLAGMLTCAHVVDFPDTIVTRYEDGQGAIQVLSIKIKQQNYINDLPEGGSVEIVASDASRDLAFLKKELYDHVEQPAVMNFPVGKSKDLDWGTVVYVMGFPVGNLMVTRAIVTKPNRTGKGRFLTDALYNRGISGSPVVAIRDGVPNFEFVGVASSAAAERVYYTKPGKESPEYINPEDPYEGDLYIDFRKTIKYGITFNVTVDEIMHFLSRSRSKFEKEGFDVERFFK